MHHIPAISLSLLYEYVQQYDSLPVFWLRRRVQPSATPDNNQNAKIIIRLVEVYSQ